MFISLAVRYEHVEFYFSLRLAEYVSATDLCDHFSQVLQQSLFEQIDLGPKICFLFVCQFYSPTK
jgi:hypothetical protein